MYTPWYKTWWFRLLAIGVAAVVAYYASYLPAYLEWRQVMKPYDEQNKKTAEYYAYLDQQKAQKEALYKADTYGGDTPEQTLDMFIVALEAGDYELASKYILPENQEAALVGIKESRDNQVLPEIITAYRSGDIGKTFFDITEKYNFYLVPKGEDVGFSFNVVENKKTKKWKIEEF